ncbi:MAG TPA: amino acid adenylation domain-containing protein [Longimicrobium sp.]|nr:amino acid adenylation domain-containing protein [Longimicrobium sp.]
MSELHPTRAVQNAAGMRHAAPQGAAAETYPLTPMQQAMLLRGERAPRPGLYVQQFVITLREPLVVPAFHEAWRRLVERHPVLRTSFHLDALPEPVQRVHARVDLHWTEDDWSPLSREAQAERMEAFLRDDRRTPFHPARAPLARFALFRTAGAEYRLVWTSHHALFDGYARRILLREVFAEYAAVARGEAWEPPAPPPSFAEYASWLRSAGEREARAFWEEALRGFGAPNELSLEGEPGPLRERHRFELTPELSEELQRLARREEVTLNAVLQVAWALLLARYTGDTDVAFGATRACRRGGMDGVERVVGLLSNTVPVRLRLDEHGSVARHLEMARALWLEMRPHERASLGHIQAWSGVPAGTPLFETLFGFESESTEEVLHRLGEEWRQRSFELHQWTSYPLAVVAHGGERVTFHLTCDPARFGAGAIRRLEAHLTAILQAFAADPSQPLGAIRLADAGARPVPAFASASPAPDLAAPTLPLHRLFEARAAQTPSARALSFEGRHVTYAELDRRANRLAHRLAALGAGPESRVGLCVERGIEMVVAILGILKAGAAYVPLDPSAPAERIGFMAGDAGLRLVLAPPHVAERLGPVPVPIHPLDLPGGGDAAGPPAVEVGPEHLAYVIYTSGSTGRPKGVQVTHGNVARLFTATDHWFGFGADDVWTLFHSYAFDFSVWEIWGALLYGGRLVVVPHLVTRAPDEFHRLLADEGVTVLNQTPSAFRQLIAAEEAMTDSGELRLRYVIFGGEALEPGSLRPWMDRHGEESPRLVNMYGITETTVHVTWRPITRADVERGAVSPVGIAIPDLGVHVLDGAGRPAPLGVPGEMYVSGAGVARGYLGRPALTAQRFVPDPFSGQPGARLYRSGDRARWLSSGELEYLGRLDEQVKIRGFRIELGEIEAVLRAAAGVADCVVIVREDAPGERRLVAYVVLEPGCPPLASAGLRAHVGARLPEYMVPSAFVTLERIPLTINGKTDRRALPAPATGGEGPHDAPRTPAEAAVSEIFAEVLGARLGVHESFFDRGGHSLQVMRLFSRVRAALEVEVPLRLFFEAPTVDAVAAYVDQARGATVEDAPITRVDRAEGDRLPLSFAQERLWFIHRMDPGSAAYNVPLFLRLTGALDGEALRRALEAVVARHEPLRTVFGEEAGTPWQRVLAPAPFPLPLVDLSAEEDGEARAHALAQEEARRPFDLRRDVPLRARLVRLAPECHLLLVTMHHVAADGWSTGILTRELGACYAACVDGGPPALPELPVRYADYAVWQRRTLAGDRMEEALAYWRAHLSGAGQLELPTDRARRSGARPRGERVRVALPEALVRAARGFARDEGATPFMVLLAGFKALLSRHGGRDDVVVGTPVAGRDRPEAEALIGFFVNTLALRTEVAQDQGFRALLGRVREATLAGYAHQHAAYERVAAELHSSRDGGTPLFRVMFAYNTAAAEPLRIPGVEASAFAVERLAPKFDLMLSLEEGPAGITGWWELDAELFERATVEAMAARFVRLLHGALAAPETPVGDLPLLSASEHAAVVAAAAGPAGREEDGTFASAFAAQAARTPLAPAVSFRGQSLSFGELDGRANRLARALERYGVGPETRVGVCMERGTDAVVAILGILKAGGAYVPLDPAHPAERLALLVESCAIPVVIAQSATAGRLPAGVRVLRLDADWASVADESDAARDDAALPGNAAYVIHTSGSTGTPKGVVVEHRSLLNLGAALGRAIYPRRGDGPARVSVNGPFTFDTSVKQLVRLLDGATLCITPDEVRYDGHALAAWIRGERVNVLDCTPAQLRLLLADGALNECGESLTDVLVAGEAIDEGTWERLGAIPGVRFHNLYGPTECTVDATACAVGDFPDAPTIGVPLLNVRTCSLDGRLHPVPPGVPGELYIGGRGVARGYLGRPGMTAERFLPDPFSPTLGARMYRTGDRVRARADGALEFLGRADDQVKIRGFRIEPGEIESALCRHPGVHGAAVVALEASPGDPRLVAYVVARDGHAPSTRELREHLAATLPPYMVPTTWVPLDELPLSAHGKTDRRALPAPDWGAGAHAHAAPRTPTEQTVAEVWAGVLGVPRIGVDDDFFALGGHSLLVARVAARMHDALGIEVPLRVVFDAPTVAGTARWIEAAWQAAAGAALPPLRPVPRDGGPLPLSSGQQRLWLVQRMQPESPAYNMPFALRLAGDLDVEALRRAIESLIHRHEVLRTRFAVHGDEPGQVIDPPSPFHLPEIDLRDFGPDEVERRTADEAARPFDLETDPVLRATLFRTDEREHRLVIVVHHVAGDGWSTGVLFRELGVLYNAYAAGDDCPLPDLPVQYADFAAWERERLAGDETTRAAAHWREKLDGAPPRLELPTDRPRPATPDEAGATCSALLSAELAEALRALARNQGATLFSTLLAGWQALLARWSGQDDIVVGAPFSTRPRTELEGLIGFFVNTLPLRTRLDGRPTAAELVRRVRETVLQAQAHQDFPFDRLVEELHPGNGSRHAPVFQVIFALQGAESSAPPLDGIRAERLPVETGTAKFDLALIVEETDDALRASLTWRTELWDAATARRMLRHYARVLQAMAAGPEAVVGRIDLLDDEERLLVAHGAMEAPARCVHEMFAGEAARVPRNTALVFGDQRMSYAELERRSDELAWRLIGHGVEPGARVGVCMERSPEMVVALLAILKAGGAYVPLDPAYPAARLSYMLGDARVPVLLTQQRLRGRIPAFDGEIASIETIKGEPVQPTALPRVTPDHLFYVIYTSGSTGTPKGMEIPHRAIPGFFAGDDYVRFDAEQVLLQHSSTSWDALTLELWPALLTGGCCVLYPGQTSEPGVLGEQVRRHGVTTLWLTSAYFNLIADTCPEILAGVRQVMVGGDAVSAPHIRRVLALYPDLRLVNGYGPSECTVFSACWPVPADFDGATVPIGRAVGDRRVYLLDAELNPVPTGIPGELCVGGPGVARGYLGRAALTAEKFIPDPFSPLPGARLYRSGDRVRRREDGLLEFVGRVDFQVKIRGFRVEPGEVETVLAGHPQVREAAVVVRPSPGGPMLAGYVTLRDDASLGTAELRAWLRERVPEHMVPGALMVLDAMPLTPHGKADRRALPDPVEMDAESGYVAPRTPVEEMLAGIWAEVLGRPRVGVHDDFFALGGHSLLATRVVARVRRAFGTELPLRALFDAPTIAGTAERLGALLGGDGTTERPPLRRVERGGPLPLSFAQQRLWFIDRLQPGTGTYNIPAALRLRGELDADALARALAEVVRRHEALRTVFGEADGEPVQVIGPGDGFRLAVEPCVDEAEAVRRAKDEAERPFVLHADLPFRARLLRLGDEDHVLLLTLHHVAGDGWSRGVLYREIEALYTAFARGEPSPLAELPVQYGDFAAWQRQHLSGNVLEAQVAWWRQRLAGAPAVLELPTDRPRPPVPGYHGAAVHAVLPSTLGDALRALSRREGATLFMTLLAAWQLVLSRWSGQNDVVVGTPIAGRTHAELEELIGFFVNTLALRADLSGGPAFTELLARVRDGALGAYAHQEVPFERLVEALHPERSLSRTPLFQVMFALQGAPSPLPRLGKVDAVPLPVDRATAKFDLTLAISEREDGLAATLEYATELFDRATVERMLGHFHRALEQVAADAGAPLSAIELLGDEERRQVLEEWNANAAACPTDACIHTLFEAQAGRTPHAVALIDGERRVTYGELNERANRIAHHLIALGAGPEVRVGIGLERGAGMVAAMLGVLKAGGAYVPLDPAYPADRLAFTLEDASVAVLVTQETLRGILPASGGVRVVSVDGEAADEIARASGANPANRAGPRNLAYLIYTSGSTGVPKGVAIEHQSAVVFLAWASGVYSDDELSGVLAATSICFDLSIYELFLPLSRGGRVIVVRNALALSTAPARDEVRLINTVPSAIAALVKDVAIPAGVRTVNLAGEPLRQDLVDAVYAAGVERVYDLYGPSEDTTYSTFTLRSAGGRETIGRPIANTQAYVLDAAMRPAPAGVAGELYLGGLGLARGYLGRPGLTAGRFVPDPFSSTPGARMYRTGDRVRWLHTGTLEYLGRLDAQVKVRGFRIELGEIEATLARHPGVREATVIVREDAPGDRRLVAYLAPQGEPPAPRELREHLGATLPDYMIPAAFVGLDRLPLTPNGKIDRRALPAPEASGDGDGYVAPRTVAEAVLAAIWAEVLGLERVGARDDFFACGGHSLLAVRLVSRIRQETGAEVPLHALFSAGTVEAVAVLVSGEGTTAARPPLVAIRATGTRRPFFCVHAVDGHVLSYAPLAARLGADRPFYGLQAAGVEGGEPLETVEAMAAAYVAALKDVQPAGPYLLGGWSMGAVVAFEAARQLRAAGEEIGCLVLIDPPTAVRAPGWHDEAAFLEDTLRDLLGGHLPAGFNPGELRALDADERVAWLHAEAVRAGALPAELEASRLASLLRVRRANLAALRSYQPATFDGPALLLRAAERPVATGDAPRRLDWASLCTGGVEVHTVPGSHHTLLREPHVAMLAERLRASLDAGEGAPAAGFTQ